MNILELCNILCWLGVVSLLKYHSYSFIDTYVCLECLLANENIVGCYYETACSILQPLIVLVSYYHHSFRCTSGCYAKVEIRTNKKGINTEMEGRRDAKSYKRRPWRHKKNWMKLQGALEYLKLHYLERWQNVRVALIQMSRLTKSYEESLLFLKKNWRAVCRILHENREEILWTYNI